LEQTPLDPNADAGVFKRVLDESGLNAVLRTIDFDKV